jgi:DNA repair exonuclease SbcCD nuclease subunit
VKFDLLTDKLDKFLWVGDPHVKKSNIEESERLMSWADDLAYNSNIPMILAGDQYNDFGIARVETVRFWEKFFASAKSKIVAIVGNHDANADMSMNFMTIHSDHVLVIDKPTMIGSIGLLPFYRQNDTFVHYMNELSHSGASYLFCHQEFNGCQYENGFYAPGGVDPNLIPKSIDLVISGHIHKHQRFDKVWYPGTARHLTKSDIGEEKGVFKIDIRNGFEKILTPVDVSEPFTELNVTPEFKGDLSSLISPRTFVNIKGPASFVKLMLKKMPDGVKVRPLVDSETVETTIKESEGIPKAFLSFAMDYANKNNLGNSDIKAILNKIYDKCPVLKGI